MAAAIGKQSCPQRNGFTADQQKGTVGMGVDLTLLPIEYQNMWASFDLWGVERRRGLWDAIAELAERPVPEAVSCFVARGDDGDPAYGKLADSPYGGPLTWLRAADLLKVSEHEGVKDNWRNRGLWKMLAEMPPETRIVLYWH